MNSSTLINMYVLPTGRRLHAHTQVQDLAQAMGLARIVTHTALAIAHDRETHRLELAVEAVSAAQFTPATLTQNSRSDKAISGFDGYLALQVKIHGPDTPAGRTATAIRSQVFPNGARAITHLPFVQQHAAVERMLGRLAEPDMAAAVSQLAGAQVIIDRIAAINAEYRASLVQGDLGPDREAMRMANARGLDLIAETVALIVAEFAGTEGDPRREELLAPILGQNTAMRAVHRRRRAYGARRSKDDQAEELPEDSGELPEDSGELPEDSGELPEDSTDSQDSRS